MAADFFERTADAVMKAERSLRQGVNAVRRFLVPQSNVTGLIVPPRNGREPVVDRFSGVLSVLGFDTAAELFVLNNGGETLPAGFGRVWELNPLLGADEARTAAFLRIVRTELPAGSVFSVSLYAEPDASRPAADFTNARSGPAPRLTPESQAVLTEMAVSRARMFMTAAKTGTVRGAVLPARRFRVWMTVTVPAAGADAEDAAVLAKETAEKLAGIDAALKSTGLMAYTWNAADYTAAIRSLVNPQKARAGTLTPVAAAPHEDLRRYAVALDTQIDVKRRSIAFAGDSEPAVEAVAVGAAGYPASVELNDMADLLGAAYRAGAVLADPYLVTVLIEPTEIGGDRAKTAVKAARLKQLKTSEIGQFLPDLAVRAADMDLAHVACEEGTGLARVAHELIVFAPAGKAAAAAESAKALFAEAGFTGETESGVQMMAFLAALPLEGASGLMRDMGAARRLTTLTRRAASHMLPVIGEWKGTGPRRGKTRATPLVLMTTRTGEVFGVDFFANTSGNYNAVIAGTSGSGKSVLAQEIVMGVLAAGGRVWVFDIGRSYRNCVDLTGGQWVDFDEANADTSVCINPLDVEGNPDDLLDEITDIVTVLANGDTPMELTESALLKSAIAEVMAESRKSGRVATITDLCLKLTETNDPVLTNLALRLTPYTAGERFGRWFEGRASVSFDKAMAALEMEGLTNKPVLQNAVLLILIMRILQEIRRTPRDQTKLIVIDEAWRLLSGRSGRFIEWACRTLRKYGAGIVCISQSAEDFDATPAAKAVKANADTVFYLRQKAAGIRASGLSPADQSVIAGLTTCDGLFSEVFVRVGDGPGVVGRLMLDAFSLTAYSTRADVYEAVRRKRSEGHCARDAIYAVAYGEKTL